ncbi:MAG: cupin domain-containing protein [Acidobacteria bacterium]|nr:cupin domain-containing protein [Acidobacteriota bacterium]
MRSRFNGRWMVHAVLVAVGVTMMAAQAGSQAGQPAAGGGPLFTGTSTTMDGTNLSVARRRFEPGARSYWHSHDNGQLLYVEDGRMRTQKRGQAMRELGRGESDYTGPKVEHWHGAVPHTHLIQVNVGFGGGTKWLEAVTEAQYDGK